MGFVFVFVAHNYAEQMSWQIVIYLYFYLYFYLYLWLVIFQKEKEEKLGDLFDWCPSICSCRCIYICIFISTGRPRKGFLSEFAQNCQNCPDLPRFNQNC